jgi:FkbM family methyltransferase
MADREVVIFGAGMIGIECFRWMSAVGLEVAAYLDNHRDLLSPCQGRPVYRPETAPENLKRSATVVLGVWRPDLDLAATKKQLQDAGWSDVLSLAGFIRRNYPRFGDIYWRAAPGLYERPEVEAAIDRVRGIWADGTSAATFEYLLRLRRRFDDETPFAPDPDEYMPADVPGLFREPLRYVDAGAYDGDVLRLLVGRGREIALAAMFEPDHANFRTLVRRLGELKPDFPRLAWPCALGDADEVVRFHQDDEVNMSSHKTLDGEASVVSVRLDSVAQHIAPNYIKMDVEGFELSVLRGAEATIGRYRPNLAVCLYHRAEDLWEIPLWLIDHHPDAGYKYYVRQHGHGLDSHCLYAIAD